MWSLNFFIFQFFQTRIEHPRTKAKREKQDNERNQKYLRSHLCRKEKRN